MQTLVKPLDRIISAKDYGGSAKHYIRNWQREKLRQGVAVPLKGLDEPPTGEPFQAVIWQGQWIVRTECCNSASFVDPDEPIMYCFTCANRANGFRPRPVTFPPTAERLEIERLILERPVNDVAGLTDNERAGLAKPLVTIEVEDEVPDLPTGLLPEQMPDHVPTRKVKHLLPLVRSWEGEPVEALRAQQEEPLRKWKKSLKEGSGNDGIQ